MRAPARWVGAAGLGLLLGVAASWADAYAGRHWEHPSWRVLDLILNAGAVWACGGIFAGWLVAKMRGAWAAGLLALAAAVAGYYAYGNAAGDRQGFGLSTLSGVLRFWLVAALVLGPVLGTIGALARRRDRWGLSARLVPSAGILAEDLLARRLGAGGDGAADLAMWLLLVAGLGWAVAASARWRRSTSAIPS